MRNFSENPFELHMTQSETFSLYFQESHFTTTQTQQQQNREPPAPPPRPFPSSFPSNFGQFTSNFGNLSIMPTNLPEVRTNGNDKKGVISKPKILGNENLHDPGEQHGGDPRRAEVDQLLQNWDVLLVERRSSAFQLSGRRGRHADANDALAWIGHFESTVFFQILQTGWI